MVIVLSYLEWGVGMSDGEAEWDGSGVTVVEDNLLISRKNFKKKKKNKKKFFDFVSLQFIC